MDRQRYQLGTGLLRAPAHAGTVEGQLRTSLRKCVSPEGGTLCGWGGA